MLICGISPIEERIRKDSNRFTTGNHKSSFCPGWALDLDAEFLSSFPDIEIINEILSFTSYNGGSGLLPIPSDFSDCGLFLQRIDLCVPKPTGSTPRSLTVSLSARHAPYKTRC
jgi:hypothetical protein